MQVIKNDEQDDPVFEICPTIGEQPIVDLVAAFYQGVANDDLLRPMYPKGSLLPAEERLRDFLIFRCGGSRKYLEDRGHPRLRARHQPFPVDQQARDRWVELMDAAFEESDFPTAQREILQPFLHSTATFLINRQSTVGSELGHQ